jgi:hypothetical protein
MDMNQLNKLDVKNPKRWTALFFSFALVLSVAVKAVPAQAQVAIGPSQFCAIPKLDGDKVPFPLKSANTKFELAEDETYLLNGFLVRKDGKVMFKLDFETQPWLATHHREQFPYFPVEADDPKILTAPDTELMQMAVVVRRSLTLPGDQEWRDGLKLDVILPPVSVHQYQNWSGKN